MTKRVLRYTSITMLSAVLWGCGSDGDSSGGSGTVVDDGSGVEVTGESFSFDPAEIHVSAGDEVIIELTARGTKHDLVVEEADFKVVAERGETSSATLSPLPEGSYAFYCSVPGHRKAGMEGVLVVGP